MSQLNLKICFNSQVVKKMDYFNLKFWNLLTWVKFPKHVMTIRDKEKLYFVIFHNMLITWTRIEDTLWGPPMLIRIQSLWNNRYYVYFSKHFWMQNDATRCHSVKLLQEKSFKQEKLLYHKTWVVGHRQACVEQVWLPPGAAEIFQSGMAIHLSSALSACYYPKWMPDALERSRSNWICCVHRKKTWTCNYIILNIILWLG